MSEVIEGEAQEVVVNDEAPAEEATPQPEYKEISMLSGPDGRFVKLDTPVRIYENDNAYGVLIFRLFEEIEALKQKLTMSEAA